MRDCSFSGLKIGLLSGPWYVLNVTLLWCKTRHAERISNKCSHAYVKLPHWLARTGEKGKALTAARNAPPVSVTEQIVQEIKSLHLAHSERPACVSTSFSLVLVRSSQVCPYNTPKDASVNQDHLACVRNTGMTSAPWQETVTCLCK